MHREKGIVEYTLAPCLEIRGNSECKVEGLKGISEYSSEKIRINLGKFSVSFLGDGLFINTFSPEGATVEGTIVSVEFESNA